MRGLFGVLAAAFFVTFSSGPGWAGGEGGLAGRCSAGPVAGTLGPGLQVSCRVLDWAAVRAEGSYISVLTNGLTFTSQTVGAMFDLHPFRNGFRVSGGMRYLDYEIRGITATGEGGNPNEFRIDATNSNKAAPYFGFGFDNSHFSEGKHQFKLGIDLGAVYSGTPSVAVTNLTNPGKGVQAEINNIANKYQFLDFYPVVAISARINF